MNMNAVIYLLFNFFTFSDDRTSPLKSHFKFKITVSNVAMTSITVTSYFVSSKYEN